LKEFWDINELSQYLQIKKSSLYSRVERKDIPFYRIGHLIRFKKSDIDLWVEKTKSEPLDIGGRTKKILRGTGKSTTDIDTLVRKSIAEVKGIHYTPIKGKPDRTFRGLGKEVKHEQGSI
jgi:excisionase family DNA binding protein